jgi:hypothetical protein
MEEVKKQKRTKIMDFYRDDIIIFLRKGYTIKKIYDTLLRRSSVNFTYHAVQKYIKRENLYDFV